MPYDGNGNFIPIPPPDYPAVPGTTIESSHYNNYTADLMGGLTLAVTRDGQSPAFANLPMGGFKHTSVAAGVAATDYARMDQMQGNAASVLGSVAGTNTITASAAPTVATLTNGAKYQFRPANATTGAVTLNIDGTGARPLRAYTGIELATGALQPTAFYQVIYNAADNVFYLLDKVRSSPLGISFYRSSATAVSLTDGQDSCWSSVRDTTGLVGGTPGFVNAGITHRTITAAGETAYEWGVLSIMDNYATAGENVAVYGQANKRTTTSGPTWAACFEANDIHQTADPTGGPLIGIEVTMSANGTDANMTRYGIDLALNRSNVAGAFPTFHYGVRIASSSPSFQINRGFGIFGPTFGVGFDTADATQSGGGAAFRMAAGQRHAYDAAITKWTVYNSGSGEFQWWDTSVSAVFPRMSIINSLGLVSATGFNANAAFSVGLVQVVGARNTGWTAFSGPSDKATAFDTATINLQQLAARVSAIQIALTTHGLLGA